MYVSMCRNMCAYMHFTNVFEYAILVFIMNIFVDSEDFVEEIKEVKMITKKHSI